MCTVQCTPAYRTAARHGSASNISGIPGFYSELQKSANFLQLFITFVQAWFPSNSFRRKNVNTVKYQILKNVDIHIL